MRLPAVYVYAKGFVAEGNISWARIFTWLHQINSCVTVIMEHDGVLSNLHAMGRFEHIYNVFDDRFTNRFFYVKKQQLSQTGNQTILKSYYL